MVGSAVAAKDRAEIRNLIIAALAAIRAVGLDEVESELAGTGDVQMDSQEGLAIVGRLAGHYVCSLPGPQDLQSEQYISLNVLMELVEGKLLNSQ